MSGQPVVTAAIIRALYPRPDAPSLEVQFGDYCVGGAFGMFMGMHGAELGFPEVDQLCEWLRRCNPRTGAYF